MTRKTKKGLGLTRKLVWSMVSVLFALTTMVTASYAWFSMNTSVEVNNLTVTVAAPQSLLVSTESATTGFSGIVSLENDNTGSAAKFVPVAYSGACAGWYQLTDEAKTNVNEEGKVVVSGAGTQASPYVYATLPVDGATSGYDMTMDHDHNANTANVAVFASGATHYYHDTIWLKIEGDEETTPNPTDKQINVKAEYVNNPTQEIKNAMHIVFVVNGQVFAAATNTIDMSTAAVLYQQGDTIPEGKQIGDVKIPAASIMNLLQITPNTAATQVDIYYFLSGNDDDCYNTNITADSELSVRLIFEIAE